PMTPRCVAFGPGGKTVAASWGPGSVRTWDVERKDERNTRGGPLFSPDGRRSLRSQGVDGNLFATIWDVATGKQLARFPVPHQGARPSVRVRAAFTADGERVAVH